MGGRRRRRLGIGIGVLAGSSLSLGIGPLSGAAGAAETCTGQVGLTDPNVCVGVNSGFGGLLVVLVASESTDTLLLAGAACFEDDTPSYTAYAFGPVLGSPLAPIALDTTIPC